MRQGCKQERRLAHPRQGAPLVPQLRLAFTHTHGWKHIKQFLV